MTAKNVILKRITNRKWKSYRFLFATKRNVKILHGNGKTEIVKTETEEITQRKDFLICNTKQSIIISTSFDILKIYFAKKPNAIQYYCDLWVLISGIILIVIDFKDWFYCIVYS